MSNAKLYLFNCTRSYLFGSLNEARNPDQAWPFSLAPLTDDNPIFPFSQSFNTAQATATNTFGNRDNILLLAFASAPANPPPASTPTKLYQGLALPGFGDMQCTQAQATQDIYLWVYRDFALFSQGGAAHLINHGTLPAEGCWKVTPY